MTGIRLISWNLTRCCNLACGHCYLDAEQRGKSAPDDLSSLEVFGIVAGIAEAAPGAMLVLTGGEPLLRDDLEAIVVAAASRGLMPVIGTNGVLLDEARARSLKKAGAAGVGISIDSVSPAVHDEVRGVAGAWKWAMRGVEAARGAGLPVLIQSTLFERNRAEIGDIVQLGRELGAAAVNFFFLVCTGRGATQTDISPQAYEEALATILELQERHEDILVRARCAPYLRRLKGLHAGESAGSFADFSSACLAGRSYIRITPEGDVTPCPYIPRSSGSLKTDSLRAILNRSPDIRRLREETPGGKCGSCDWRLSCGGCRARALASGGDLMAEDAKCAYHPPAEASPETAITAATNGGPCWHPEAAARLDRIPDFVRERVRRRLEEKAAAQGLGEITPDFMLQNRPPWLVRNERPPATGARRRP